MGLTCHHPPLPNKKGKHNWVSDQGGLPSYIDCRARAIYHEGPVKGSEGVSRAIRIAVGVTEDEAEGRRKVTAKTRAMAQAAIAKWEAMRLRAKADN